MSKKAESCPNCGKPFIQKKKERRGCGCLTSLIVLIVYFAGLFLLSVIIPNYLQHKKTEKVQTEFDETNLIRQLKQEVKDIPISDIDKNLKIYRKLAELDPYDPEYKEKIASYTKQKDSWIIQTINGLVLEYRGKIVSIEKLDEITCWAILNSNLSYSDCLQLSKNIGLILILYTIFSGVLHLLSSFLQKLEEMIQWRSFNAESKESSKSSPNYLLLSRRRSIANSWRCQP